MLIVLAVLVGCQPVGGLDLNRALLSDLDTKSLQQSAVVSLHFKIDPKMEMSDSTKEMIELLNDAKLELQQVKMESLERMSVKGQLSLSKGNVPFHIFASADQMVMKFEGISKTIVYPVGLNMLAGPEAAADPFGKSLTDIMTKIKEKELDKKLVSLFVTNLPNPKNINVNSLTETIHNEPVGVYKLETSMSGSEFVPLLKTFIRNLTKDDKNFKQLISDMYDVLWPVIEPHLTNNRTTNAQMLDGMIPQAGGAVAGIMDSIVEAAKDKELAVDFIHTTLKELLYFAYIGVDGASRSDDGFLKSLLSDKTNLKTKLYFDRSLLLRKSEIELSFSPQGLGTEGISAVELKMQSETWDHNKPVKADVLEPGPSPFVLDKNNSPFELLNAVDPSSVIGQLLASVPQRSMEAAEPDVQYIAVADKNAGIPTAGYVEKDTVYAPLWLAAKGFSENIEFNQNEITVTGVWVDEMKLVIGSNVVVVDGEKYEMDGKVEKINETVYVPLEVVEYLGGFYWYEEDQKRIGIISDF